jgi:hypothetical protein
MPNWNRPHAAGEEMLNSRRQELILQIIKGSDITPVENSPGCYTAKSTIYLTVGEQQVTVRPTDLLDLLDQEFFVVHANEIARRIPWDQIVKLEFEEQESTTTFERPHNTTAAHRMLHFPLGKKSF